MIQNTKVQHLDIEDLIFDYAEKNPNTIVDENIALSYIKSLNLNINNFIFNLKNDKPEISEKIIIQKLKQKFMTFMRMCDRQHKTQFKKSILMYYYRKCIENNIIEENPYLEIMLLKNPSRDISGINQITLLTSPTPDGQNFSCKHDCYYCPNEPAHEGNNNTPQPRSYLFSEPAVQRANRNMFNPIFQTFDRLNTLIMCGHKCDKLEFIIEGGTFTEYPKPYLKDFFRDFIYACNIYQDFLKDKTNIRDKYELSKEIELNKTARCKIIGICIETRPDSILEKDEDNIPWIQTLLEWGVTRIQLGVQHIDNRILKRINRGHNFQTAIKAIQVCKDNCFKIDIHIMPDLPGSSPQMDMEMFDIIYTTSLVQPDQMKIYPCAVVPWTILEKWYQSKNYIPYGNDKEKIQKVLTYAMEKCPSHIRIPRMVRDIPHQYISGGLKCGNMRQVIETNKDYKGNDIRYREIGRHPEYEIDDSELCIKKYIGSGGIDYFISVESKDKKALFAFCRLRIVDHKRINPCEIMFSNTLKNKGLIRELHVYGSLVGVINKKQNMQSVQHYGLGRKLLKTAEYISLYYHFKSGTAVISGIGVRGYYEKFGYELENNYMVKDFYKSFKIKVFLIDFVFIVTLVYYLYFRVKLE